MLDSNQVQPVISSVVTPVALEGFKTPLLNEYPGASAAYSLRRLKSWDDGGRVVRVRRSSDNAEADFKASEVSDGTLVTWVGAGNDGFVETWYDQSGNGNDAVQQVSGSQPKIVDGGVLVSEGGKPAFNVDGVDDLLELGSTITNVGDFYVSLVSVMEETSGLQAILGADTNTDYLRAKDSTWLLYTGTGAGDTGNVGWSATFDSRYLMSFNRSGSTVTAQLNGSSAGTGTNGNDIGFITKLFQRGGNTTQLWKGNVQELIIYDSDQSANRVAIEANINNQYDIY